MPLNCSLVLLMRKACDVALQQEVNFSVSVKEIFSYLPKEHNVTGADIDCALSIYGSEHRIGSTAFVREFGKQLNKIIEVASVQNYPTGTSSEVAKIANLALCIRALRPENEEDMLHIECMEDEKIEVEASTLTAINRAFKLG